MKDSGSLHYFLGVKSVQDSLVGQIWIGQPTYTDKILQRYMMQKSKPVNTPVNSEMKLVTSQTLEDIHNQQQ